MAKVITTAWFPRSYIHLFETYKSIDKVELNIKDLVYDEKKLTFTISGYEDYMDISFTQGWSGLHYFIADIPDGNVVEGAKKFMVDMQNVLVEKILKVCHTVTYKQILSDVMSLDFHTIILSKDDIDLEGYMIKDAMGLRVAQKEGEVYSSGDMTFVMGSEDIELKKVLLYHCYVEVASVLLMNLMKSMIRLYHNADDALAQASDAKELDEVKEPINLMDEILQECMEKNGKLRQVLVNFKLKEQEFYSYPLEDVEKSLSKALQIPTSFKRLESDGSYMSILWADILKSRLENIQSSMHTRIELQHKTKKSWF